MTTFKKALRKQALAQRHSIKPALKAKIDACILHNLDAYLSTKTYPSVGGYMAMQGEIDITPLLLKHPCPALPVVQENTINFFHWDKHTLIKGAFGIQEPPPHHLIYPACLLVPLLCIDNSGYRLGYGGGYYDRYLTKHTPYTIGIGYTTSRVPTIYQESFDIPLHAFVCEDGVTEYQIAVF
jgi:5-formyltetrahydrofolate cyclo-ligase